MGKTHYDMKYSQYACLDDLPLAPYSQDTWIISNKDVSYLHCHNSLEIVYWVEGEGKFLIENKEYLISQGDICVLCPKVMHQSYVNNDNISRCKYLYIDLERFQTMYPLEIDKFECLKYHSPEFVNIIRKENCLELVSILLNIFQEIEQKPFNYQASVLSRTSLLLIEILRKQEYSIHNYSDNYRGKFVIAASIDYMNVHFAEDISTEQLAFVCHMSVTNYRRVFKKIMQISPMMYLNRLRIEKACECLFLTNDTVLAISEQVGYKSICSFNNNFRKFLNCSPQQWRTNTRISRIK